ncbi:hypothetical protein D8S78_20170 [Natrialba swarupiae]|nr:hypothetical protein [Natrialba swarupiae]
MTFRYDGEIDQNEFGTENPIGTGPFQLEKWEQGSHLSIERFDDYHGDVPEIDDVHWSIMDDSNARLNRNLDVFTMQPSQFDPGLLDIDEIDDDGGSSVRTGRSTTTRPFSTCRLRCWFRTILSLTPQTPTTVPRLYKHRRQGLDFAVVIRFLSCSVSVPSSNASATCLSRLLSGFWPGGSL